MFDTHCHLNFKALYKNLDMVVAESIKAGVTRFVVPGTDIETSKKAIDVVERFDTVYAAVGIHPHHIFEMKGESLDLITELEAMVQHPKVVAIGEIGLDRHRYTNTKYKDYVIGEEFMRAQKKLFVAQLELAKKYKKSVIIHSRETTEEVLEILEDWWDTSHEGRVVFHCCEPDERMLDYAIKHDIFIGVDGDVTFSNEKQEYIKNVPLERLVVETDSPFLLPEPLKSQKKYPNTPANLLLIVECVSKLKGVDTATIIKQTTENAVRLFNVS